MKNASKSVLVILLVLSASIAFAQHRGGHNSVQHNGYSGGHNSVQHNGGYNNGWQHNGYNGDYRHSGYGWGAPVLLGAGVAYLFTRPYYDVEPSVVYYEPLPRMIPAPQQPSGCHRETRKIFDEKGQSFGAQVVLVCPIATTAPPATTTE